MAGTAQYYFLRAQAAYGVKEMLEMLGKALKLDKQHYDSLRERAYIYYIQHDYEKMARDAARMIGIRPDKPQGYALSALALQELGRLDEALLDHNEAIQLAPDDSYLCEARSEIYTRGGRSVYPAGTGADGPITVERNEASIRAGRAALESGF